MSDQDTLGVLATEIGSAFEPVGSAFGSPESFAALMEALGWEFDAIPAALNTLTAPAEQISALLRDGEVSAGEVPQLLGAITGFIAAVNNIASQPTSSFPPGFDDAAFKSEFPRQFIDFLVIEYFFRRASGWGALLKLTGIVRLEDVEAAGTRLAFTRRTMAWEDLGRFFSDPTLVLRNAYRWGQPDFKGDDLIANTADALDGWQVRNLFSDVDPAVFNNLTAGAVDPDDVFPHALRIPFYDQNISGFGAQIGLELLILPQTAAFLPGFSLLPYARGEVEQEIPLTEELAIQVQSEADFAGGIAIIVRPNQPVDLAVGFGGGTPTSASLSVALGLVWRRPAGTEIVLIGSPSASRLRVRSVALRTGARVASTGSKDLYFETEWTGAGIVVKAAPGEADSFLASLLPAEGLQINFDFTLGISSSQGVYFGGSGGLDISLPAHIQIGPVEIQSAQLAVRPSEGAIPVTLGATIRCDLGPLKAVVENIGLSANFTFPPNNQGNLGPADVRLKFKPPNGIGLSVDAGVVKGGGYLFLDFERGEYAGALELVFSGFLTLTAIGIITTRMPDGSAGFSLLIIITAEFGTGIQLGFGFTLLGVGGLIGLNRTMLLEPLMTGVRTGAINGIMFPRDVVANAPRIISDMRAIFPPYAGKFLIGPMAKLGWGTPTLISLSLGIIIEIPGNIAILGVLRLALPTSEAAVLVIQVNFAGAIEFDRKRVYFFAAMFESRVLFMPIEGEMGVLAAFGSDANFVVSVGGFHPRFTPPPLPFPSPRRVSISILNQPTARIRVEGYFAVTTNTVQFGARAELVFGFDALGITGEIAFDALFQFSPFYFIIELSASLSVRVFGVGLFSVRVRMSLEGPTPWRARGEGSISFFFFDISVDFDITWGETRETTLPPISVMPIVRAELAKPENWIAILPTNNNLLVALRQLPAEEAALVLHPVGVLRVSQKAVPLGIILDKIGTQRPDDIKQVRLNVLGGGLAKKDDRFELFAPAQFRNFSDADKLSQPAFTPERGGVDLSVAGNLLGSSQMARRIVRYERIIIDSNFQRQRVSFYVLASGLFTHFLTGSAVTLSEFSTKQKKRLQPFEEKVRVNDEAYTVANQSNNRAFHAEARSFKSPTAARDYLQQQIALNPNLADELHVIPDSEVAA